MRRPHCEVCRRKGARVFSDLGALSAILCRLYGCRKGNTIFDLIGCRDVCEICIVEMASRYPDNWGDCKWCGAHIQEGPDGLDRFGYADGIATSFLLCYACDKEVGRQAETMNRTASSARRRALMLQAIPAWADMDEIKAVYAEAKRLTIQTGIPHEVDHYIPLNSPYVCGLHVPANLRVITADDNRKKSNAVPDVNLPSRRSQKQTDLLHPRRVIWNELAGPDIEILRQHRERKPRLVKREKIS